MCLLLHDSVLGAPLAELLSPIYPTDAVTDHFLVDQITEEKVKSQQDFPS